MLLIRWYRVSVIPVVAALTALPLVAASTPLASQSDPDQAEEAARQTMTPTPTPHVQGTSEVDGSATSMALSTFTPELSPTQDPSASATLLPSETALPSVTPTSLPPSPTAGSHGFAPYPAAPSCPDHDAHAFHGLWDAERGCHYDHSHGDDPHAVDDIFGTAIYEWMDGEISYPWHTSGENESIKHMSYIWLVERDLPCSSRYTDGCITAFRAFLHNDLHNPGPSHHSALLEAIVCDERDPERCGYVFVSGHQATGDLLVDRVRIRDVVEPRGAPRPVMLHSDRGGNRDFAAWYPVFYSWMRVSTQVRDMWGYYPVTSDGGPEDLVRLAGNASAVQPHIIAVGWRPRDVAFLDPDRDGLANYDGFVDVHSGVPGGACTGVSANCAPLVFRNVPIVRLAYQYNSGLYHEFDVFFGRQSSGWLEFPGFQR